NFNFLTRRKPEARPDKPVLEHDRNIFELRVEEGRSSEAECHTHDLTLRAIDIDGTDDPRLAIILRADAHLVDVDASSGQLDAEAIRDREVVLLKTLWREWVRNVANFVAFAEANDVWKVVLNDAEVIAMVGDVRRQQQCITSADNALLAEIGRTPVDFQRQLI